MINGNGKHTAAGEPTTAGGPTTTGGPSPLGGQTNGYVVLPKWFVSFLSFLISVVLVGAILWAWAISTDVSAIKAELRAQSELRVTELQDVRRRLDRHDDLFDRLLRESN